MLKRHFGHSFLCLLETSRVKRRHFEGSEGVVRAKEQENCQEVNYKDDDHQISVLNKNESRLSRHTLLLMGVIKEEQINSTAVVDGTFIRGEESPKPNEELRTSSSRRSRRATSKSRMKKKNYCQLRQLN